MKLFVYESKSWLFLATKFETIDWYKINFKKIFDKYEENKNLTADDKEISFINGQVLKYIIFGNGEIKIKRNSVVSNQIVDIIAQYELEII